MSRKITAGLFMSVDGVAEAPDTFQHDSFDAELGAGLGAFVGSTTDAVLGRVGYTAWSSYWPGKDEPDDFGAFINPIRKHVASTTLSGPLEWNNSTLIQGDLATYLRELKNNGEQGNIAVVGGINIVRSVFFAGLLDELQLMIHPVIAGTGRHLFQDQDPQTRLTLVDSTITSKGNALLTYSRREG
ncbi:dihydrofolate reductase family protein [Galactobacter caseinivorans]|uniref:Dihydrofolate reductase n=1 Tax=Galactobacter caseinivorans TaxID=2676123 RepID=A0A496PHN4_9MICC|nr:dihydrofolate reductase family protein [Galactobacter caseinivorans]RKW69997.1 dihydrofolate reductase [Galactobacter caseinivorans]